MCFSVSTVFSLSLIFSPHNQSYTFFEYSVFKIILFVLFFSLHYSDEMEVPDYVPDISEREPFGGYEIVFLRRCV